ncbi:ABC transporter substrate-binding protein [Propylenella binzhouense]|nr:ABC transporter substrate-binding protein [Propylenella binzhouense]
MMPLRKGRAAIASGQARSHRRQTKRAVPGAVLSIGALMPAAHADTLRIGAFYPLSGSLSVLGTEALAGAQVAVDTANEQGGVDGHEIELVVADATNPANATSEARRLVTREGVRFPVGTFGSSIPLAIAGAANRTGSVTFDGSSLDGMTAHDIIAGSGLLHVPEGREPFPFLSGAA